MSANEESEEELTVFTEPSAPDERQKYGAYRLADDPQRVERYRKWWRANPLNNLWQPKAALWRRFKAEVEEGKTPEEASIGGANLTLDDIKM
jgi:hypothetical protein